MTGLAAVAPASGTGWLGSGALTFSVTVPADRELPADPPVAAGHRRPGGAAVLYRLTLGLAVVPPSPARSSCDGVGDQRTRAAVGGERAAGQLLGRPHGGVDVQQPGALLVGGRVDVASPCWSGPP